MVEMVFNTGKLDCLFTTGENISIDCKGRHLRGPDWKQETGLMETSKLFCWSSQGGLGKVTKGEVTEWKAKLESETLFHAKKMRRDFCLPKVEDQGFCIFEDAKKQC